MRIRIWPGFMLLGLGLAPVWAGAAGTPQELVLCVNTGSATLDSINNTLPDDCTETSSQKPVKIEVLHDGKAVRPSSGRHMDVEKIIVVIQAAGEDDAYNALSERLQEDYPGANARKKIWLVAPRFSSEAASGNWLRWETDTATGLPGYAMGNATASPENVQLSSFTLLDHFLVRLEGWAPNVTDITVVGLGRNAEFVNRYSMGTLIEGHKELSGEKGANVRYLVVSPDRYTYLSDKRFSFPGENQAKPTARGVEDACDGLNQDSEPHFNRYPYGLAPLPASHYMSATPTQFRDRVKSKRRLFLVGATDVGTADSGCAARQQGPTRRNRALVYAYHLRYEDAALNAGLCVIDGRGNDPAILKSNAATLYWKHDMVNCALEDAPDVPAPPSLPVQTAPRKR